jgi:uncharacterized alkaline shock family protein YloU
MNQEGLVLDGPIGRVELTGAALASLVARSAETIAEVRVRRPRRQLRVTVDPSTVHVALALETTLGSVLPDVGEAVQRSVARAVGASTGLRTSVDVMFEDLV